jgi:hypothetical protein
MTAPDRAESSAMKSGILSRQSLSIALAFLALSLTGANNTVVAETPVLEELQKLLPEDSTPLQRFGQAADFEGHRAIVLSTPTAVGSGTRTPKAYIYGMDSAQAFRLEGIVAGDAAQGDDYYGDVVIDGKTAILSDPNAGIVYAYEKAAHGIWMEVQRISPADWDVYDLFGAAVAIQGDSLFIGAPQAYVREFSVGEGTVHVYERHGGTWMATDTLTASDAARGDAFGASLAVDGGTLLVGAPGDDGDSFDEAGSVYVFDQVGGAWVESQKLTVADPGPPYGGFGHAVDIKGNALVIGALRVTEDLEPIGFAYIFEKPGGTWQPVHEIREFGCNPFGNSLGGSVAITTGLAIVGDADYQCHGTYGEGGFHLFGQVADDWENIGIVTASDAQSGDAFGFDLAVERNYVIAGAVGDDDRASNSGAAYVYRLSAPLPNEVALDFRPGNDRNTLNPRSEGRLWVAILSNPEFDALQVDPATVALGQGGASPDLHQVKHANRDRLPDLMLRFRTPEVGFQCGDTEVELTGETYARDNIIGTDAVKTVGCKKKPKKGKKN